MKHLLRAEELAQLALAIAGLYLLPVHLSWWLWPLVFLAPDLSMAGYLLGPKAGAWAYNIAHHKLLAGAVLATGFMLNAPWATASGLLLWGHSSFDRALGYGLKYPDTFHHTHLGMIGKGK